MTSLDAHWEDWEVLANRGACRNTPDPTVFFPANGVNATAAKRICADCPVRAECLQWALDTGQRWGVWGGTTEKERRPLNNTMKQHMVNQWLQQEGAA